MALIISGVSETGITLPSGGEGRDAVLQAQVEEIARLREQLKLMTQSSHDLIATQAQMQSLLHRASDAIIQFDADGLVTAFNSAAERIFGYAEITLLHRPAGHLIEIPPEWTGTFLQYLSRQAREVPDQYQQPLVGLREDGARVLLEVSIAEIREENLIMFDDVADDTDPPRVVDQPFEAFLCILRDITDRKRVDAELRLHQEHLETLVEEQTRELRASQERAIAASKAKSEFLANMSHEFRTPMHAVLSYSEMGFKKVETASSDRLRQYFERINTSGRRLLGMIDDLLDVAKAEAGRLTYRFQNVNLKDELAAVFREYAGLMEQQELVYLPDLPEGAIEAWADAGRIGQVVRNYLSNAVKFTEPGNCIRLSVEAVGPVDPEISSTGWLFTVSDQGSGVPEEELEAVFNKFVQGSHNRESAGGTGLGLAISREIIEAHRGRFGVRNNADGGADFYFLIPGVSLAKHREQE